MKKAKILIVTQMLLLTSLFAAPALTNQAHGAVTGIVCIAPDGASSCPSSPPTMTGSKGAQLRVSVFIQNSSSLNVFDVILLADHTVLKPADAQLTGTILPGPQTILEKCVGGVLVAGNVCSSTDTVDTLHFAVASAPGTLTNQPATGLLFTAIYNVTAASSGTALGFQTGCGSPTAPTSHPPSCVTIANGGVAAVPEIVQTATFSTSTTPDFVLGLNPGSINVNTGSSGMSTLTITSVNNFAGTVNLAQTISPSAPTVTLGTSSVTLSSGGSMTAVLTVTTKNNTATGLYIVTVTGTSGTLSHTTTLNINVVIKVVSPLAIDGSAIRGCDHSTNSCSLPFSTQHNNDIIIVYALEQLDLLPSCTFNINDTASLSWAARSSAVFGNGGRDQIQEFWAETTNVLTSDSIMESISGCASFQFGGEYNGLLVFGITGANFNTPFDPNIALPGTASGNSMGTSVQVSTTNAKDMIIGAVLHGTNAIPTAGTGFTLINATGTVAAEFENVNSVLTNSTVTFGDSLAAPWESIGDAVQLSGPVTPDFFLTASPRFLTLTAGSSANSSIVVTSINGFSGTATVSATTPNGLTTTLNPTTVNLSPGSSKTSTLTTASTSSTPPGNYAVTITGTNGTLTHSTVVNVNVQNPDFTISASPVSQTVPPGTNTTFTINLVSLNGFSGTITFTSTISPVVSNLPTTTLIPASVVLVSNSFATATLLVRTQASTSSLFYTITVTGSSGGKVHTVNVSLQVLPPPDEPPIAGFTFTPSNPNVGQNVNFDGSSSVDPDGFVNQWTWSFGDGGFLGFGEFTNHVYNSPGNFTVTLTVSDISGGSASKTTSISVRPQPPHDAAITQISVETTRVVSTQSVPIQLELTNTGASNETVSVTVYANGRPVQALKGIFLRTCGSNPFCFSGFFLQAFWDTNGVSAGNYTISATVSLPAGEVDPTPSDNTATDGTVTVLPAPIIVISPNSGVDGTKVLVQGSGFPVQQQFGSFPTIVYVNFDNMSVGFTFSHNGTFAFTFDVPLSQPGAHGIFAFDPFSGAHASAVFTVQPTPTGTLAVSINMGTIYFPGDTAVAYVLTTFNGAPIGSQNVQLQLILFRPDGTNITLTATPIGNGLYKATYAVPSTGTVLGTYLVLAKAHQPGPIDSTSLASFEVKPTWISSNGGKITVGATTLAGVIGIGAVAWKKGYFRRKNGEDSGSAPPF